MSCSSRHSCFISSHSARAARGRRDRAPRSRGPSSGATSPAAPRRRTSARSLRSSLPIADVGPRLPGRLLPDFVAMELPGLLAAVSGTELGHASACSWRSRRCSWRRRSRRSLSDPVRARRLTLGFVPGVPNVAAGAGPGAGDRAAAAALRGRVLLLVARPAGEPEVDLDAFDRARARDHVRVSRRSRMA